MVFRYEPLWDVGKGHMAVPEDAEAVCRGIGVAVGNFFGAEADRAVGMQHGGWVEADNATERFAQPDIDGAPVGSASLHPDPFAGIAAAGGT